MRELICFILGLAASGTAAIVIAVLNADKKDNSVDYLEEVEEDQVNGKDTHA